MADIAHVGKRLGFLLALILCTLPPLALGKGATVGTVSALEGDVRVRGAGETEFASVRLHQPLFRGDFLRTGENGKAQLVLEDDSMIVMAAQSDLEISEFLYRKDAGERKALFGLLRGKVRFLVTRFFVERREDVQFRTTTAVVGVRGTEGIIHVTNPTVAHCFSGTLALLNLSTGEKSDIGPLIKASIERGRPILVEPIDPRDVQALRGEFLFKSRSPGAPQGVQPVTPWPRGEPPTQEQLQDLSPLDLKGVPERPQYPHHQSP
jgi:hypothetical protein